MNPFLRPKILKHTLTKSKVAKVRQSRRLSNRNRHNYFNALRRAPVTHTTVNALILLFIYLVLKLFVLKLLHERAL